MAPYHLEDSGTGGSLFTTTNGLYTGTDFAASTASSWVVGYNVNIDATGTTSTDVQWINPNGTLINTTTNYVTFDSNTFQKMSDADRAKQRLKAQHKSTQRLRGRPSFIDKLSPQEVTALKLLRGLVSPENFRKYLKYGFVTVRGQVSGMSYNVYRSRNTIVFDDRTELASLCVHLNGKQPPTDEVIAKVLMAECSEPEIWQRSNVTFRNRTQNMLPFMQHRRAA